MRAFGYDLFLTHSTSPEKGSTFCLIPGAQTPRFIICSDDCCSLMLSNLHPAGVIAFLKAQLSVALDSA